MLQFPEHYFDREVRDDFTISELMKRAWAAQLELLQRVIEICDKYHLTYYAYWGTLLGAVRHHGFIPWDDDMDIAMKRDDYIKFLEVAGQELPESHCIFNAYTEEEDEDYFTRITNGRAIDFSDGRLSQNHGCPFVVGIDIFPLYYIPGNQELAEQQKAVLNLIGLLVSLVDYKKKLEETKGDLSEIQECNVQLAEGLVQVEKITGYHFTSNKPLKTQLEIVYDQVCRLVGEEESDCLTAFPVHMMNGYCVEKELLAETLRMPFENIMMNAPVGYDRILKESYHDYMTPRKNSAAHDYPFYKEQLSLLGKHMEREDLKWKAVQKRNELPQVQYDFNNVLTDEQIKEILPLEWREKIYAADEGKTGKRNKVILYYTGAEALLGNSELVLEKLRFVLETFKKEQGVLLWWFPCFLDIPSMQFVKQMAPQLVSGYQQILEDFRSQNWGIYDDTGDIRRAIAVSDAFFGDEGEIFQMYQQTGKWAMIQNYGVVE